jgi:hypothetical protein
MQQQLKASRDKPDVPVPTSETPDPGEGAPA